MSRILDILVRSTIGVESLEATKQLVSERQQAGRQWQNSCATGDTYHPRAQACPVRLHITRRTWTRRVEKVKPKHWNDPLHCALNPRQESQVTTILFARNSGPCIAGFHRCLHGLQDQIVREAAEYVKATKAYLGFANPRYFVPSTTAHVV